MPTISIIVPVYNVEAFVGHCIESILAQSYTDFELLLIDDGSTDNSGYICDNYASTDSRIKVFHKTNGGVSSARNVGLDNAHGEWIVFVDSDDYVQNSYIEYLIDTQRKYDAELVVEGCTHITNNISQEQPFVDNLLNRDQFDLLFTTHNLHKQCSPWGKLFNRNIINETRLRFNPNIHLGEDIIFVLSYLLHINKIYLLSRCDYAYIARPESLTKRLNSFESELYGLNTFSKLIDLLIEEFGLCPISIQKLREWQIIFYDRTINAVATLPKKKNRYSAYRHIDFSYYFTYKRSHNWKEQLLTKLLFHRCFRVYDFIIQTYTQWKK